MKAADQFDHSPRPLEFEQLPVERNTQGIDQPEITGALRVFVKQLALIQFLERRPDLIAGEIASGRVLELQQRQQLMDLGPGAVRPQQGGGQGHLVGIGGQPQGVGLLNKLRLRRRRK